MSYRLFFRSLALLLALVCAPLTASEFVEGKHFKRIDFQSSRTVQENAVEVAFFYSYGDHTSYLLNSHLQKWLLKSQPQTFLIRRPNVATQKEWALALNYIRAEMLGISEEVHAALFAELHKTPPGLNSMEELVQFNAKMGIRGNLPAHVLQANFKGLNSEWKGNDFGSIPALVIAQQYLVTREMVDSEEEIIKVLDFLVEKSRETAVESDNPA